MVLWDTMIINNFFIYSVSIIHVCLLNYSFENSMFHDLSLNNILLQKITDLSQIVLSFSMDGKFLYHIFNSLNFSLYLLLTHIIFVNNSKELTYFNLKNTCVISK